MGGRRRIPRNVVLTFVATLICTYGLTAAGASSSTASLKPVADASVSAYAQHSKFGDLPVLGVSQAPSETRTFLRFDLDNAPAPLARATLRLYAINASDGFDVHDVVKKDKWNEKSIKWKNQPSFSATVAASSGATSGPGWVSVDVTDLVRDALRGGKSGDFSIALTASGARGVAFASSEAPPIRGEYLGPQLVLKNDVTPPAVSITAPPNGSFTRDTTPAISGVAGHVAGDSTTLSVLVYAGPAATGAPLQTLRATRAANGAFTIRPTALAEGPYTVQAVQSDADGNVGTSNAVTFAVDLTAPVVSISSPANGGYATGATPTIRGAAGALLGDATTVTVKLWAGDAAAGPADQTLSVPVSGGAFDATPAALVEGTYTVRAEQTDAVGNIGRSAFVTFSVDLASPRLSITAPASGSSTRDLTPTVRGIAGTEAGDDATVSVSIGSQTLTAQVNAATGAYAATASTLGAGTYAVHVVQRDAAGHVSTADSSFTVVAPSYVDSVLAANPVAYWRLGESTGTVAADAASGHANPASYVGDVQLGAVGAIRSSTDTAATLGGASSEIDAPGSPALSFGTDSFTLETWVRTTAAPGQQTIAQQWGEHSSSPRWEVTYTDSTGHAGGIRAVLLAGGNATAFGPDVQIGDGEWHHVVVTFDRALGVTVWIDGVAGTPSAAANPAPFDPNQPVTLGTGKHDRFPGDLDEVALYRGLLTPEQIAAHLAAAQAPPRASSDSAYAREVLADSPLSYLRLADAGAAPVGASHRRAANADAGPDGVYTGTVGPTTGAIAGDADAAATFAGAGEVDLPTSDAFAIGDRSFTVETWVKTTARAAEQTIASQQGTGGRLHWELTLTDDDFSVKPDGTPTGNPSDVNRARAVIAGPPPDGTTTRVDVTAYGPNVPINDGQWHQVVATFDRTAGVTVWVDGIRGDMRPVPSPGSIPGSIPVRIGSATPPSDHDRWTGDIDEFALYGTVLSPERIRAHAAVGLQQKPATPTMIAAGDIAACDSNGDEQTAEVLARQGGLIQTLGDNAYENGTAGDFAKCFEPTWGAFKSRIRPALGNHEYRNPDGGPKDAAGYFGYFGPKAGNPAKGYYSYTYGGWHVVVLNTNDEPACSLVACDAGSPQEQWLRDDLAAHPTPCTVAVWHAPRWSSGVTHGSSLRVQALWADLAAAKADLVLNGHEHMYERFAPLNAAGQPDANGVREFVVGTGGGELYDVGPTPSANSEKVIVKQFGFLKLTLRPDGYDWAYVGAPGGAVLDSGTGVCH